MSFVSGTHRDERTIAGEIAELNKGVEEHIMCLKPENMNYSHEFIATLAVGIALCNNIEVESNCCNEL